MDVALCLHLMASPQYKYGGSVTENTEASYNAIRWEDERPKPTWQELTIWWNLNKDTIEGNHE